MQVHNDDTFEMSIRLDGDVQAISFKMIDVEGNLVEICSTVSALEDFVMNFEDLKVQIPDYLEGGE